MSSKLLAIYSWSKAQSQLELSLAQLSPSLSIFYSFLMFSNIAIFPFYFINIMIVVVYYFISYYVTFQKWQMAIYLLRIIFNLPSSILGLIRNKYWNNLSSHTTYQYLEIAWDWFPSKPTFQNINDDLSLANR